MKIFMRWIWLCSLWRVSALDPICTNCKFLKGDYFRSKYGKCTRFPKGYSNVYELVNGKKSAEIDYFYCNTARKYEDMCGLKGQRFEKR